MKEVLLCFLAISTIECSSKETGIMVASNEYLIPVRQVAEPFHKVYRFIFCSSQREITRMDYHVSFREMLKLTMIVMRIGYMEYLHLFIGSTIILYYF